MSATASRGPALRAALLLALLAGGWVLVGTLGAPDVGRIREGVAESGWWGPVLFAGGYALWALLPAPKSLATATAGMLFGLVPGAIVAWSGAMVGAVLAFGLARLLGREGVDRLLRGRLERADAVLGEHGFGTILLARLVPVLPFTVINYGAGVTGVVFGSYVAGSALGMIPGTVAYAALGAVGDTDPTLTGAAVAALVVLSVGGWWLAARLRTSRAVGTGGPGTPAEGRVDV